MGQVIRFPLARRLAEVGRGARVFEAIHEEEQATWAAYRFGAQALTVSMVLTSVLQLLVLTA